MIIHKINGGKTMKKRQATNKKFCLGLVAVVAVFLVTFPCQVGAQTESEICNSVGDADSGADFDNDGFTDFQECNGIIRYIVMNNGPVYPGWESGEPRENRLGPAAQDLFVILVPANPSKFPPNPLEFVSNSTVDGGLGIFTHQIPADEANPDRFVSPFSTQKAVRITEDPDPEGIILGYANQGTPNGLDDAIIYTNHIYNHVDTTCAEANSDNDCVNSAPPAVGRDAITQVYIKHTIAHEIGHMTLLAVDYNRRFGGYHYKAGSGVVLEQAVSYTSKKGKVTFYISTEYAEPSQQGIQLQ
jgi:hypothetical protein